MNNISSVKKTVALFGLFFAMMVWGNAGLLAQHNSTSTTKEDWEEEVVVEDFKAGEMIIEHITDSYEWHLISIGETHYSIPLPIILYDEGKWHIFMSGVFHHADSHVGYYISHLDFNAGKIVKKGSDGEELRPTLDISITKNVVAILMSMFFMIFVFSPNYSPLQHCWNIN